MDLSLIAAAISSSICVTWSLRALRGAIDATSVNPMRIAQALRVGDRAAKARRFFHWAMLEPAAVLERELLEAALDARGEGRVALINAVLSEVDFRVQSQTSIPRVCARVSSTVGLLAGASALRRGLVEGSLDASPAELLVHGPVADMLACVLMGIAGATWCASIARAMRATAAATVSGQDALVERLELLETQAVMTDPGPLEEV